MRDSLVREFQDSQGFTEKPCLKKSTNKHKKECGGEDPHPIIRALRQIGGSEAVKTPHSTVRAVETVARERLLISGVCQSRVSARNGRVTD